MCERLPLWTIADALEARVRKPLQNEAGRIDEQVVSLFRPQVCDRDDATRQSAICPRPESPEVETVRDDRDFPSGNAFADKLAGCRVGIGRNDVRERVSGTLGRKLRER